MQKGKVTVIGAGFVGSTTAYTLMLSGVATEIVLIDINRDKAEGDALDMSHGAPFVPPVKVIAGDYEASRDSEIVIITAGVSQKPGETRTSLLSRNIGVFKTILGELLPRCADDTLLLVVTNPVDILTYATLKLSGLPKNRVIGSGTVLDTARLRFLLGEHTGIDVRNVHAYIIGEHGDTEVPAWSLTSIAGMPPERFCQSCHSCEGGAVYKDELYRKTRDAAYGIIEKKGATYYAVALAVRRIAECIIRDENSILTVSGYFEGEYSISDVCLSVPSIVDSKGILKILEIPFSNNEIEALRHSADTLKALIREIGL